MKIVMLGIIGVGRMGSAIAAGLVEKKVWRPAELVIHDLDSRLAARLAAKLSVKNACGIAELAKRADICLIAVKPQDKESVIQFLKDHIRKKPLISIMAGVPTSYFEARLGEIPVVRVMPNIGIKTGAGLSFYAGGRFARKQHLRSAAQIFGALGEAIEIPEKQMNLVTALSGSGPAYFFLLMECLAEYGRQAGLPEKTARHLAQVTGLAAALLAEAEDPVKLRAAVTSRAGTTEAAMRVLEEAGFREIFSRALAAAVKRSRELSGG